MALTTLTAYKAFFNITDTTNDARITEAINVADAIITTFLGRSLESTSYTEYHDGNQAEIILDNTPVISITSVSEDTVATTDYTIYEDEGRLVKGIQNATYYTASTPKFNANRKGVEVIYTAGYVVIPYDLAYCANLVAKKVYTDQTKKTIGAASGVGGVKRQRLHNEDRERESPSSNSDLAYIASQVSVLPAEVISILRSYY